MDGTSDRPRPHRPTDPAPKLNFSSSFPPPFGQAEPLKAIGEGGVVCRCGAIHENVRRTYSSAGTTLFVRRASHNALVAAVRASNGPSRMSAPCPRPLDRRER